jgi:addiction module antidote protein, HigA family
MSKKLMNIHPGEILMEEFLEPLELSQNAAARAMDVPPRRVNEICLGKRAITPDTAIRLSRFFGTTPHFWLGLQNEYDLEEMQGTGAYRKIEAYTVQSSITS